MEKEKEKEEGEHPLEEQKGSPSPLPPPNHHTPTQDLSILKDVDIHIMIIPPLSWRRDLRCAYSVACFQSVSAGFVRVPVKTSLIEFRFYISKQLNIHLLPEQYALLRKVGRYLTLVNDKQEEDFTINIYAPPIALHPELYIVDQEYLSDETLTDTIMKQFCSDVISDEGIQEQSMDGEDGAEEESKRNSLILFTKKKQQSSLTSKDESVSLDKKSSSEDKKEKQLSSSPPLNETEESSSDALNENKAKETNKKSPTLSDDQQKSSPTPLVKKEGDKQVTRSQSKVIDQKPEKVLAKKDSKAAAVSASTVQSSSDESSRNKTSNIKHTNNKDSLKAQSVSGQPSLDNGPALSDQTLNVQSSKPQPSKDKPPNIQPSISEPAKSQPSDNLSSNIEKPLEAKTSTKIPQTSADIPSVQSSTNNKPIPSINAQTNVQTSKTSTQTATVPPSFSSPHQPTDSSRTQPSSNVQPPTLNQATPPVVQPNQSQPPPVSNTQSHPQSTQDNVFKPSAIQKPQPLQAPQTSPHTSNIPPISGPQQNNQPVNNNSLQTLPTNNTQSSFAPSLHQQQQPSSLQQQQPSPLQQQQQPSSLQQQQPSSLQQQQPSSLQQQQPSSLQQQQPSPFQQQQQPSPFQQQQPSPFQQQQPSSLQQQQPSPFQQQQQPSPFQQQPSSLQQQQPSPFQQQQPSPFQQQQPSPFQQQPSSLQQQQPSPFQQQQPSPFQQQQPSPFQQQQPSPFQQQQQPSPFQQQPSSLQQQQQPSPFQQQQPSFLQQQQQPSSFNPPIPSQPTPQAMPHNMSIQLNPTVPHQSPLPLQPGPNGQPTQSSIPYNPPNNLQQASTNPQFASSPHSLNMPPNANNFQDLSLQPHNQLQPQIAQQHNLQSLSPTVQQYNSPQTLVQGQTVQPQASVQHALHNGAMGAQPQYSPQQQVFSPFASNQPLNNSNQINAMSVNQTQFMSQGGQPSFQNTPQSSFPNQQSSFPNPQSSFQQSSFQNPQPSSFQNPQQSFGTNPQSFFSDPYQNNNPMTNPMLQSLPQNIQSNLSPLSNPLAPNNSQYPNQGNIASFNDNVINTHSIPNASLQSFNTTQDTQQEGFYQPAVMNENSQFLSVSEEPHSLAGDIKTSISNGLTGEVGSIVHAPDFNQQEQYRREGFASDPSSFNNSSFNNSGIAVPEQPDTLNTEGGLTTTLHAPTTPLHNTTSASLVDTLLVSTGQEAAHISSTSSLNGDRVQRLSLIDGPQGIPSSTSIAERGGGQTDAGLVGNIASSLSVGGRDGLTLHHTGQESIEGINEDTAKVLNDLSNIKEECEKLSSLKTSLSVKLRDANLSIQNIKKSGDRRWRERYFQEKEILTKLENQLIVFKKRSTVASPCGLEDKQEEGPPHNNMHTKKGWVIYRAGEPSEIANLKIQCWRLQDIVKDLRERLRWTKLQLAKEKRLRHSALERLRKLKQELVHQQIQLSIRNRYSNNMLVIQSRT